MERHLTRESVGRLKSELARRVELHEVIGSTQGRARELALSGAPHGTLVVSRAQSAGKGRLGRRWGSPPGGLWMSVVLRPPLDPKRAPRITQIAAVAAAKALREMEIEVRIKWPNDLLVGERKICGILSESGAATPSASGSGLASTGRLDFAVLGVGLNANLDPADLDIPEYEATSIRSELGHDVDLLDLLRTVLQNLQAELVRIEDFESILRDWRLLNCTLGERVRVKRSGETLEGVAVDLSPEGALLVEAKGGIIELFEGEIEHLR